jgi:hypothetical protein
MAQFPFKQDLIGPVDVDSDETKIQTNRTFYKKNLTLNVNSNPNSSSNEGINYGVNTPYQGTKSIPLNFDVPAGNNNSIGYYQSFETNEVYFFIYNSNNNHFIYRINGKDGTTQIIYANADLNFQYNPIYFISQGRSILYVVTSPTTVASPQKYLLFTDNFNPQRLISVDDSAASNSYSPIDFPYFAKGNNMVEHSYLINLGVAPPMDCVQVASMPRTTDDANKQNLMVNKTWQFRIMFIDIFNRNSEHGVISAPYIAVLGGGSCVSSSSGLPRSVNLSFDSGGPLVNKIQIEYRNCFANTGDLTVDSDWKLYDTIDVYDNSDTTLAWYQRPINPAITYDNTTNAITYLFSADKGSLPIDITETNRFFNPLPILSATLGIIDESLFVANNVRGYAPLDPLQLDKLAFDVVLPVSNGCETQITNKKIVVYAQIYSPFNNVCNFIRYDNNIPVWGYANKPPNDPESYDQVLANPEGWVGYLVGTNFSIVSSQVQHTPGTNFNLDVYLGPNGADMDKIRNQIFQRWEFSVPAGKYVFRVAGHAALLTDQYASTSTYVSGQGLMNSNGQMTTPIKELVIDVCSDDYLSDGETDPMLVIWDMTYQTTKLGGTFNNATMLIDGYLYEDQQGSSQLKGDLPIENVPTTLHGKDSATGLESPLEKFGTIKTDHNGFFFGATKADTGTINLDFTDCVMEHHLYSSSSNNVFANGGHKYHNNLWAYMGTDKFPVQGRREIKGQIVLCTNPLLGLAGQLIIRETGAHAFTDTNGFYTITCHENYDEANDTVIYGQRGLCSTVTCDGDCSPCFSDQTVAYIPCTGGIRVTTLPTLSVNMPGLNIMGPQNGGRYGLGIILMDWMGRSTFVQANDSHFVDIPSLLDTHTFNFSTITFNLTDIVFPDWVCYVSVCITDNLAWQDFISWSVDKVEFVDGAGNVNNASPTQIRITYASLSQYNSQNNFATNTNWQIQTTNDNGESSSVLEDSVEFYINGDGTWFSNTMSTLISYDNKGQSFIINYNDDLSGLLPGALIKFVRPLADSDNIIYRECCPIIPVIDGVAQTLTGNVQYFDSYFIQRQIPVPTTITTIVNNADVNTTSIEAMSYSYLYESPSPSDFWGDHCHTRGRIQIKNPFEGQYRIDSEIALSDTATSESFFNGLNYFDPGLVYTYDKQAWGAIVVIFAELQSLLVICEHSNFLAAYKDNRIYVDAQGNAVSNTGSNNFGSPQRKPGNPFGCQMIDINTIQKGDGIIIWMDRAKAALVFSNYTDATDISIKGGFKSYMLAKIGAMNELLNQDLTPPIYAHGCIDPKANVYYLTFKFGTENIDRNVDGLIHLNDSETMEIDIAMQSLNCWTSFVPEYFGAIEGFYFKKNIVSIVNGEPWLHHHQDNTIPYNNFYGVQCKKIFGVVVNLSPEKVKTYMCIEVYCKEHRYIIQPVTTESGQVSRLLRKLWDYRNKFWVSDFKCDLNTVFDPSYPANITANPLHDGDALYGRWAKLLLLSDGADDALYSELTSVVTYVIADEKSAD